MCLDRCRRNRTTSAEVSLPVGAVVDPAHLLARLQQVKDPRGAAGLLLHLRVATLHLGLGLRVYVKSLFVGGLHGLIDLDKVEKVEIDMRREKQTFTG